MDKQAVVEFLESRCGPEGTVEMRTCISGAARYDELSDGTKIHHLPDGQFSIEDSLAAPQG